jgi:hypothetical protein
MDLKRNTWMVSWGEWVWMVKGTIWASDGVMIELIQVIESIEMEEYEFF